ISAVDSGNLAGLLLVLKAGLEDVPHQPLLRPALLNGLQDSLRAVLDLGSSRPGTAKLSKNAAQDLTRRVERMLAELQVLPDALDRAQPFFGRVASAAAEFTGAIAATGDSVLLARAQAYESQCHDLLDEFSALAPWLSIPFPSLDRVDDASPDQRSASQALLSAVDQLNRPHSLAELAAKTAVLAEQLRQAIEKNQLAPSQLSHWHDLAARVADATEAATERVRHCERLAQECGEFAEMDFTMLYDSRRELLAIGYNATDHRRDQSFYDLLASEARLASYVAISQHQLPRDHWFSLGRMATTQTAEPTLLSWSGSMFEYLMPPLVMPTYENTLLDAACRGAVARQIEYGRQRKVPWGISESCYHIMDGNRVYQYHAFGVPGLGLQRGLGDDLVIAPYATAMATMFEPHEACRNLDRLEEIGALGEWGLIDAVDYSPSRLTAGGEPALCKTYMAHHSGMSFLALDYVLHNKPMQARFHQDPLLKAHDLLLQERVPTVVRPVHPHPSDATDVPAQAAASTGATTRGFETPDTPYPEVHLLSNGNWHVLLTQAGGGYSRWRDLAITRWNADYTRDADGLFCYLRDLRTNALWATTYQPTVRPPRKFSTVFSQGRVEYRLVDEDVDALTAVSVSSEDDVEVRRITLKNLSRTARKLELTTYAEIVLAPPAADSAHRAFSNLFVQTELLPERRAILCTRRPRSSHERQMYVFHLIIVNGQSAHQTSFETDRARFIGRGRDLRIPACFDTVGPLSNTHGSPLDPIVAIRQELDVEGEGTVRIDVVAGAAETREQALALIDTYQDHRLTDRVFELAWTHSQVVHQQIGATAADVQLFSRLAGPLVFGGPQYRASAGVLSQNRRPQSALWPYGISGDRPIVLVRVTDVERVGLVRQLLQAHIYWRQRGLSVDLVIWNDDFSDYRQPLHDAIMALVLGGADAQMI
ncbi:MAG TPA: glucoamylase family protein, partial [Pirellulales bacterium]